ncbi:MAG TPA: peptidylprolyl isomerase [bacterium]|nr:peptidylprolyl isomerase [bacterium]
MRLTKRSCTWLTLVGIMAAVFVGSTPHAARAQSDPVTDSIKQAEARRAMEAEADSARRAADNVAARVRAAQMRGDTAKTDSLPAARPTDTPVVVDTTTPTPPAGAVREPLGDTAAVTETPADTAPGAPQDTAVAVAPAKPIDPTAPYKDVTFDAEEKPIVVFETSMGNITIELWPDVAMKHCQNFVYLINRGFYDSLLFHRVVPGFVIQAGDPTGAGTGGPGYTLPAEFSTTIKHDEGILSMARKVDPLAKPGEPERPEFLNSAGSQFFICLGRAASLDGKYTAFGEVIEGMDVVQKIAKTPAQRERPLTPVRITKAYVKPKA